MYQFGLRRADSSSKVNLGESDPSWHQIMLIKSPLSHLKTNDTYLSYHYAILLQFHGNNTMPTFEKFHSTDLPGPLRLTARFNDRSSSDTMNV